MNATLIKHRLIDLNLTLLDLAKRSGMAYDRVVKVVNGYRPPRPEEIDALGSILGVEASELGREDRAHLCVGAAHRAN